MSDPAAPAAATLRRFARPDSTAAVGALLFGSGACALVYQLAWTREFRLVFGASTAASAAVLAVFIGGLGAGGLLLGPRADRHPRPLAFYARLEALVALSAAVTPFLLWLVRAGYVAAGGSAALGPVGGTLLRLLLAGAVIALPCLLMGGTLPAAARAVAGEDDPQRRRVAALYGINTLGAVAGALLSTFALLELLGTRRTLWLACAVNLSVAALAGRLARRMGTTTGGAPASSPFTARDSAPADGEQAVRAPAGFVLAACGLAGFAFFLMELVWYRMLAPLLGGSVFTFGLILALALLGIAIGGALYAGLLRRRPATLGALAWTCLAEAAAIALPVALGDRIALLALALRGLGDAGFHGLVLGWTQVAGIVVLPAAIASGVQFPLLIALLGRGRREVGRHVGLAYAWNTAGAILGALAGGFGLLPALGAVGCWKLVAFLLLALALASESVGARAQRRRIRLLPSVAVGLIAGALLGSVGPTAAWRHSAIGAGRASPERLRTANGVQSWLNEQRRVVVWEADGVESSVALQAWGSGLAFAINGKVDGSARGDSGTQVMSGLLGALLHPEPKRALVIGLGTGSSAGWLAQVPGIERVDVVELEPRVLDVARACAAVNRNVLDNPKVRVRLGDAREALLTSPERYDVIFSEPSNPYRAGVASLFTLEYYRAAAERLAAGGIFVQWVQAYEIDAPTFQTIQATLGSVFPSVDTWRSKRSDLLLFATREGLVVDVPRLRARAAQEPFRSALDDVWRTASAEGVLARFVAGPTLLRGSLHVAAQRLNTDDRNHVEFGFARSLGLIGSLTAWNLLDGARAAGDDRPRVAGGEVDWERVEDERFVIDTIENETTAIPETPAPRRQRARAHGLYLANQPGAALAAWRAGGREPEGPLELALVAETLAEKGDEGAAGYAEALRAFQPAEADAVLARLRFRQHRHDEALGAVERALARYRNDPWPSTPMMGRALSIALGIATTDAGRAPRVLAALSQPFALRLYDEERLRLVSEIAGPLRAWEQCVQALSSLEPHPPWQLQLLLRRQECYRETRHPLAASAGRDVERYLRNEREATPTPTPRSR